MAKVRNRGASPSGTARLPAGSSGLPAGSSGRSRNSRSGGASPSGAERLPAGSSGRSRNSRSGGASPSGALPAGFRGDSLLLLAVFLSGCAALGYELLWTRLLALVLGCESLAVMGVLSGLFGGMMVGAFFFNGFIRRARHPLLFYVVFVAVAAIYAAASPRLLHWLGAVLPSRIGPVAGNNDSLLALSLATAIAAGVLLPATVCLGGTLAAVVEAWRRRFVQHAGGAGVGRLYAANTVGGALGVAVSVYVILPGGGLVIGGLGLALIGLVSMIPALLWHAAPCRFTRQEPEFPLRRGKPVGSGARIPAPAGAAPCRFTRQEPEFRPPVDHRQSPWLLYVSVFGTGLAGIGLEVIGVMLMSVILENTFYTFPNILAVYLVGTALGAWIYQHFLRHAPHGQRDHLTGVLLLGLALAVGLVAVTIKAGPTLLAHLAPFGSGYARRLAGEFAFAVAVFTVPTVLMGGLFSHLVGKFTERGVGKAAGVNMLGGMLASFVFGLAGVRLVGMLNTLYMIMAIYLLLALVWMVSNRVRWRWVVAALVSVAFVWGLSPADLGLIPQEKGWVLLERREGLMGVVSVMEHETVAGMQGLPFRLLKVNKLFRMGGGSSFSEKRMGHMGMLLAPDAERVLFLGVGTGTTLGAVRQYPVKHVDALEIVPEVLDVMGWFDADNDGVRLDPRVSFHPVDARRFVAATSVPYDLIVGDLFHPGRNGASNLYSLEHFGNLGRRVTRGGIVAQWLPLYQFDAANLKVVIRTFLAAFTDVHGFIGLYNTENPVLLLAGLNPQTESERLRIDIQDLRNQTAPGMLAQRVIQDELDFLASYFADREALEAYAGEGALNRDLDPVLLFNVPKSSYMHAAETGYATLRSMMPYRRIIPPALIGLPADEDGAATMAQVESRYRAVGHYLEAEFMRMRSGAGGMTPAILAQYIEAYKADADFAPARGQLILASDNPAYARRVYQHLNSRDRARVQAPARSGVTPTF